MREVYDYLCSFGELIDKLCIENIKVYDANRKIGDERRKEAPSDTIISAVEAVSRTSGEQRVRIKNEINIRLKEAIERGGLNTANEVRTYR